MFNVAGQYYRAYSNISTPTSSVPVSSQLGTTGGPQAWDFSVGPTEVTYRFNYIPASQGAGSADFVAAGAQLAEQKVNEANTNDQSFLYFTQDPIKGRQDYGFYDAVNSPAQPASVFNPALQDFPNSIHYGDTWTGRTVYETIYSEPSLGDFPEQVTYTSSDLVDAYGFVTLPSLGFFNCLRVHESVQYDVALDLGTGSGYQHVATQYILNYYWLAPGHGIVVQINSTSPADGSRPPDSLPDGAAAFVRMFALNHPTSGTNSPITIKGFKITVGSSAALLQWTAMSGVSSYRVEYTTNMTANVTWQSLGTTTSNFMLDSAAPAAPRRYYRVVGTLQ
jgi:hypothetical protein